MKMGFRTPSLQKSISAKLSVGRNLVQNLGFGKGLIPDRKKQRYNRRYRKLVKDFSSVAKQMNTISLLRSERLANIQLSLKKKGYYKGPVNGRLDLETVEAIKKFQEANGILPTGELDIQTVNKLQKS